MNDVQSLSQFACNRLQKELMEWQVNAPFAFTLSLVIHNIQRWVIEITGECLEHYSNEIYHIVVEFPEHYPMVAPQVSSHNSKSRIFLTVCKQNGR
ncbi:putative ubiquitin-conjugating enzyme E2 18, partial [Mucuna pruriens]